MDEHAKFEIWHGDDFVAETNGPRERALSDAIHYARQYAQDNDKIVRVYERKGAVRFLIQLPT